MAGLEVIGAIAAAAQLATYSCNTVASLRALLRELQSAPRRIQERADDLDNLIEIVGSIDQDHWAQSTLLARTIQRIHSISSSIKSRLSEHLRSLQTSTLKRALKVSFLRRQEKDILEALASLEQNKSTLLLFLTKSTNAQSLAMSRERHTPVTRVTDDGPQSSPASSLGENFEQRN